MTVTFREKKNEQQVQNYVKIWSIVPFDDDIYSSSVLFFFWLWNAMEKVKTKLKVK